MGSNYREPPPSRLHPKLMEKLFLVDAYALIFRFHYAFLSRPMRNAAGLNTSAIFGFAKFITSIIEREHPHHIGVAFDPPGGNFRHELYPLYKANRDATPPDIIASVPHIKVILEAMKIPILEVRGFEADDVIGTLAEKASLSGTYDTYMVTPDKDYGQLIRPNVSIYKPAKGENEIEIIGIDKLCEHYGIADPRLVRDILALWGDASDNIPGVPGIGEKGARKLVGQWGDIEQIIANVSELTPKLRESIITNQEQLRLSKVLATIDLNVPIEFEPERLVIEEPDYVALRALYSEYNFSSLLREIDSRLFHGNATQNRELPSLDTDRAAAGPTAKKYSQIKDQLSLFDTPAQTPPTPAIAPESQYSTLKTTPHTYHTIETGTELKALVELLANSREFCFDTETTGLDPLRSEMVGLSIALEPHTAYWIPTPTAERRAEVMEALRPIFTNPAIGKVGQNIKFDMLVLRHAADLRLAGPIYDTMIIHYLLDPEARHNMDFLARSFLGYEPIPIEELIGHGARQITMDRVDGQLLADYAAEDADVTLRLKEKLWPLLENSGQAELYNTIEEPLIGVLAAMESNGIYLDRDILGQSGEALRSAALQLEAQTREIADMPELNVNSPKQLGEVLFEKLAIVDKAKKTKTGQYRTDEESLQAMSELHPIIGMILEYRGLRKLLTTYIDSLPTLINPATGRIHSSFNQAVTSTGRLSSTNPNLQNIPIRDAAGRELRRAFTAQYPDECVIMSADYSQVELRIMAHLSGDEALREAFLAGEDIHTATAAKIFGCSHEEVTREQRRRAKTANFGIIYGISAFGLAQRLDIPRPEAKELIDGYFANYPGVKAYMDRAIEQARERGYVETIFGRRRYLADIRSSNGMTRAMAERNAINAPIQGSAADIMKRAMIRMDRELTERALGARIVLQVHDELVLEVPREEITQVAELLEEAMSGAATLTVPLLVESGWGDNWLDAH